MLVNILIGVLLIGGSIGFGASAAGAFYMLDQWRMRERG